MKFGELRSIAHNLAHSVASGLGLPVGYFSYEIFTEVQASPMGYMEVDFIGGEMKGAMPSDVLSQALLHYKQWLLELAAKHGGDASDFAELRVRYSVDRVHGPYFVVTVTNTGGRTDTTVYGGFTGKVLKKLSPA